jgi:FtsP/CotA-like multicopper oxidase with cupredoxin domain
MKLRFIFQDSECRLPQVLASRFSALCGADFFASRTAGILKDVVMLGGYQEATVDFVADNPGLTLFHCHQQLHMDFGFMTLFDYI